MSPRLLGRRRFTATLARGALGVAAWSALPSCVRAPVTAGGAAGNDDLIERNDWPEHWETAVQALGRDWLTPNDRFFVRSHFPTPEIDPSTWRLETEGMVSRGHSFTLAELRALPQVERVVTLECAGNGRGLMPLASTSGTQWGRGAVGTARWGGVPLAALLERIQPSSAATHVWLEGADQAPMPDVPKFLRSLPIAKAREAVLLALTMNGAPLPPLHGAPLRAVVPGWYGMASTKWLVRLALEDRPSDNHFQIRGYRWNTPGEDPTKAAPVETLRVKSLITRPLEGARLAAGRALVQGFAWAGPPGVRTVEISEDQGRSWRPAEFRGEKQPGAWRAWAIELSLAPGPHTLMARATGGDGEVQPAAPAVNAGGYGNNMIHRVAFDVRG